MKHFSVRHFYFSVLPLYIQYVACTNKESMGEPVARELCPKGWRLVATSREIKALGIGRYRVPANPRPACHWPSWNPDTNRDSWIWSDKHQKRRKKWSTPKSNKWKHCRWTRIKISQFKHLCLTHLTPCNNSELSKLNFHWLWSDTLNSL